MNRFVLFFALALSTSVTYFNEHAADRVKWQPWGPAAFDRARNEDKLIALVVGSFAPHATRTAHAAIDADASAVGVLKGTFVPVLLDRAEFPAVAQAYAAASDRQDSADVAFYVLTPDLEWLDAVANAADYVAVASRWKSDRDGYLEESRLKVRRLRARLQEHTIAPPPKLTVDDLRTLERSTRHDVLGGGFFREAGSFDKNLEDQAILATAFLDAGLDATGRNALEYAVRDLQMRNGGFNDSQQADSLVPLGKPVLVDGAYYLWDRAEIMHVFGPKTGAQLCERFGIGAEGKHLPRAVQTNTPDATLAAAIAKMLDIRLNRPMPARDEPVLESNALMISALARSCDDRYTKAALLAAAYIQRTLFDRKSGQLWRRAGVPATAADYASLVRASIDLYEATLDSKWLAFANDMQTRASRSPVGNEVPEPVRDFVPSTPEPAAANLVRLRAISGRDELPPGFTRVIIFGAPYRQDTTEFLRAARASHDPSRVIVHGGDAKHPAPADIRIGSLQPSPDGTATAHICRAAGCSDAITSPDALAAALK